MAVKIDIPGIGTVTAENAASEATLNEILKAVKSGGGGSIGGGSGGGGAGGAPTLNKNLTGLARAANVTGAAIHNLGAAANKTSSLLTRSFTGVVNAGLKVQDSMEGLARMGMDVGAASRQVSNALGMLPGQLGVAGAAIGAVVTAVVSAVNDSTKAYQQAASAGASFSGSVGEFAGVASQAGMDMKTFGAFIRSNSQAMQELGGTTEEGAKRFGAISKQLRDNASGLYALGYSTEDLNKGIAGFVKTSGNAGRASKMTQDQLADGARSYLKELDALAKLTGRTREEQEAAGQKIANDAAFQAAAMNASAAAAESYKNAATQAPTAMQDAIKELLVTGTVTGKNAELMAMAGHTMEEAQRLHAKVLKGEVISSAEMERLQQAQIADQKEYAKNYANAAGAANAQQGAYADAASAFTEIAQRNNKTLKDTHKEQEKATELTDGQNMALEKFRQRVGEVSNQFTMLLANSGVFSSLFGLFEGLVKIVTVLVPVWNAMAGSLTNIVNDMLPGLTQTATALTAVIRVLVPWVELVIGVFTDIYSYLMGIFGPAIKMVSELLGEIFGTGSGTNEMFKQVRDFIKNYLIPILSFTLFPAFTILGTALKKLYESGFTLKNAFNSIVTTLEDWKGSFLDIFDEIGDGLQRFLNKVTFGQAGISEEEFNRRKQIRDDAAAERAENKKRASQAWDDTAKAREVESKIGIESAKEEKEQRDKYLGTGAAGRTPQQGYAEGTQLGKVAAHFESRGNAGTISSGAGDHGGKSYGAFQLSSKTGDVNKFLNKSGYAQQFAGMDVGSAAFDAKWKELAKSDKNFESAQYAHAKSTHFDPQMAKLQKSGIDLSGKGAGVQEAIMSTANQYGANTDVIVKALQGKDSSKMSDNDIINAIQDYKASTVGTKFKSSSAAVQAGVAKRIEQERNMLLGVQGPAGTATAATAATGTATAATAAPGTPGSTANTTADAATGKNSPCATSMEEILKAQVAAAGKTEEFQKAATAWQEKKVALDEAGRKQLETDAEAKKKAEEEKAAKQAEEDKKKSETPDPHLEQLMALNNSLAGMGDHMRSVAENTGEQIGVTRSLNGNLYAA